jgi:hypothetical protein
MIDHILKYLFASEQNAQNVCIYINAHIKECDEFEIAQIIIDLRSDNEQLTKIIEYFKIY